MRLRVFLVLVLALALAVSVMVAKMHSKDRPSSVPEAFSGVTGNSEESRYALELIRLINQERDFQGLSILKVEPALENVAAIRAEEIRKTGTLSLDRLDGSDWSSLLLQNGIWGRVCGENHSHGNMDPAGHFNYLVQNPEDMPDFFYDRYTHLGLAVRDTADGSHFVVIIFATEQLYVDGYREEVLNMVNYERSKVGRSAVAWNNEASRGAMLRADEIQSVASHKRPDGRQWSSVLEQLNISCKSAGENIAAGQKDARAVMKAWMDSPGHRENILRTDFNQLGVGLKVGSDGKLYWTQLFLGR